MDIINTIFSNLKSSFIRRIFICAIIGIIIIVLLPTNFITNVLIEQKFKDFYPMQIKIIFYSGIVLLITYIFEWIDYKIHTIISFIFKSISKQLEGYELKPMEEDRTWKN